MRGTLLALGIALSVVAGVLVVPLAALASGDDDLLPAMALAAVAIAGPLFGGIAASQGERPMPLVVGCIATALAVVVILQLD